MPSRWIRIARRIIIVFLVLLVAYFAWWAYARIQLHLAYEALRKDGRPMRIEEIIPKKVADADNAAPLYNQAFTLIEKERAGKGNLSFDDWSLDIWASLNKGTLSETEQKEVEDVFNRQSITNALALVKIAVTKPACAFRTVYGPQDQFGAPHVRRVWVLSRLLILKARLEVLSGHGPDAWPFVIAALRLGDALGDEPLLLSCVERSSIFERTAGVLQSAFNVTPPTLEQTEDISYLLRKFDDQTTLVRALDGERLLIMEWLYGRPRHEFIVSAIPMIKICSHGIASASPQQRFIGMLWPRPLIDLDHAAYLKMMLTLSRNTNLNEEPPFYCLVAKVLCPSYSGAFTRQLLMQTKARMGITAMALRRHKIACGRYPATLAEIDPTIMKEPLLDPFSGKSFIYRTDGDGFILYSVGENGKDDGGRIMPDSPTVDEYKTKPWDIVWKATL